MVEGIRRVQSWLQARKLWFVQPWCPRLISDLRSYRWAEAKNARGESTKEKPVKRKDDLPDALRYAVMGVPDMPGWDQEVYVAREFRRRAENPEDQWMFDRLRAIDKKEKYPAQVKQGIGDFFADDRSSDNDDSQQIVDSLWHTDREYGDDY